MPLAGKLTDRFGGGPLALFGVVLTTVATIPFALIGAHTSIVVAVGGDAVPRHGHRLCLHAGDGGGVRLPRASELSDATPQLNVLQRVGGSIGIAVLAVVLTRAPGRRPHPGGRRRGLRRGLLGGGRPDRAGDHPVRHPRPRRASRAARSGRRGEVPEEALAEAMAA